MPLVAGMAGMHRKRFLIANVGSAFLWAPAHVYPAQLAGLTIERLNDGDMHMAAMWGGALLMVGFALWYLHRRMAVRLR